MGIEGDGWGGFQFWAWKGRNGAIKKRQKGMRRRLEKCVYFGGREKEVAVPV